MVTETYTNGHSTEAITISPPKFLNLELLLRGTAPYLQARFSEKAREKMRESQAAGSSGRKGKLREPRDFDADYLGAMHVSEDGWHGIPASAFRNAAIDACRMAGFHMTKARMSIFVRADGLDKSDATPLVRIVGEPEKTEMMVRNATGVADIRVRPMWRRWEVTLIVTFDGDQFTNSDVVNLFNRAGLQVGVGEGRPFSKSSNGMGYGTFEIVNRES